jgi:hypothetical protein
MPVTLDLHDEGRIMVLVVEDPWTMNDLKATYPIAQAHLDSAPYKVHTLADLRNMHTVPPNALWDRRSPNITHPNSGLLAVVGGSMFARSLAETAFRIMNFKRVRFFDNVEGAWAYLREVETGKIT